MLHLPISSGPCVVACHGLGASKDSDKYALLARVFAGAGLALARFDFRGCGDSTGAEEETTVATRVTDVRAVLARLRAHPRLDGRFGLLGSSLGGFVALQVAASSEAPMPVVTWNAPASLADLLRRPPPPAGDAGQALREELGRGEYLETPPGVRQHLIVQGTADDVVRAEHADLLRARGGDDCALLLLEGGDHRLSEPAHRERAALESLRWFQRRWA